MKTIFAGTTEELYKAVEENRDLDDCVEIVLKKDAVYYITEPLRITGNNVSVKGDNTVLKGSRRIPINDSKLQTVSLSDCGIEETEDFAEGPFADFWFRYAIPKPYMDDCGMGTAVFYEDELLPTARYPKRGFIHAKTFLDREKGVFIPEDEKIFSWKNDSDLLLIGYWQWEWANQRCRIEKTDRENKTVSVKPPYHCFGYKDGAHYYVLNVRDEISEPGEWTKTKNTITIYPKKGQRYMDVAVAGNIIEAENISNLQISGIEIRECRRNGIKITGGKNIRIEDCCVKNAGGWGIIADCCENARIERCIVSDTGGGGIAASGGNREQLISSENQINRCSVRRVAKWHRTYMAAIQICGVGGKISRCKIEDVPHFAIVYHGNNHIIEKNEICNACYEANDAGAIYSGADWSCRGNIIRENYFHDINGFLNRGCYGIYFDDYVSSAQVYNNLFVNVHQGILIGGGRDYKIYDNFFYGGVSAILIDDRMNVRNDAVMDKLFERIRKVRYQSEIWRKAYPELYDIENQNYDCEENNKIFSNHAAGGEECKNFVYIKNGERNEFERESDFIAMCNFSVKGE